MRWQCVSIVIECTGIFRTKESLEGHLKAGAKKVVLSDSEADNLKNALHKELVYEYIIKDAASAPRAVALLLISRHLERICDHATNIAEDVIYMVQAKVARHHPEILK